MIWALKKKHNNKKKKQEIILNKYIYKKRNIDILILKKILKINIYRKELNLEKNTFLNKNNGWEKKTRLEIKN